MLNVKCQRSKSNSLLFRTDSIEFFIQPFSRNDRFYYLTHTTRREVDFGLLFIENLLAVQFNCISISMLFMLHKKWYVKLEILSKFTRLFVSGICYRMWNRCCSRCSAKRNIIQIFEIVVSPHCIQRIIVTQNGAIFRLFKIESVKLFVKNLSQ